MIVVPQKEPSAKKAMRYFFFVFAFLAMLAFGLVGVQWFSNSVNNTFPAALDASASTQSVYPIAPVIVEPVKEIPAPPIKKVTLGLQAQSALSVAFSEGQSAVLFEKNSQQELPIASLTKLMTALLVLERYDLSQQVTISAAAMAQEGEQGNLKLGETLSVRNLLYIMLMESSNRAAYALSEIRGTDNFIASMNEKAAALGMTHTHFDDSAGLSSKSYSTASDLVVISQYLFDQYPLFREIVALPKYDLYVNGVFHHTLISTNKLLGTNNIIGGKTGYTDEARGCFIAIQSFGAAEDKQGSYRINIILGADDRFLEMQKLIQTNSLK